MELKQGDWIYSYSKGIFRIEEIVNKYYEECTPLLGNNKIGDEMPTRTIVSKKFLSSTFKKSFGFEVCDESLASKLSKTDLDKLENLISEKPHLLKKLDEYEIPQRQTIFNLELQIEKKSDLEKFDLLVKFINKGKTYIEIENEMETLDLLKFKPKYFGNYLLRFINYDDELRDKRRVWKNAEIRKQ